MYKKILDLARLGYSTKIERDALHLKVTVERITLDGQIHQCQQMRPDDHHFDDHHFDEGHMIEVLDWMVEKVNELIEKHKDSKN